MKFSFFSLLPACVDWRIFFAAGVDLVVVDNIIANSRKIEQNLTAIYAQIHYLPKSKPALYAYNISINFTKQQIGMSMEFCFR
ncbi:MULTISPECIES: hypothetical protein [unclassified Prochlorococcus]|uniref:hypothetical protein n=1 Tax=unclassified Prochlorococcus TaxID=2627481 RepID=UPI0005659B57|nr:MULTISPECIES: hypothetical protein [unclassified Prochlorococcus]